MRTQYQKMTLWKQQIGEDQGGRMKRSQRFLSTNYPSIEVTKWPSFKTFFLRVKMGKFWNAKKTNRLKVLTKTAKEFSMGISCSPMKQVLVLVEGQIDANEIQKIYWDKDGQNMPGNIGDARVFEVLQLLFLTLQFENLKWNIYRSEVCDTVCPQFLPFKVSLKSLKSDINDLCWRFFYFQHWWLSWHRRSWKLFQSYHWRVWFWWYKIHKLQEKSCFV